MKLQFIIRAKNKSTKRQHVRYNFLELHYVGLSGIDNIVSFDFQTQSNIIKELSKIIVFDWAKLQIAYKDDFIFGASNIDDKLIKKSLVELVEKIISSKFNNEFINQYTGEEYKLLFTLSFTMVDEDCKLISFTIKDI